jgi:hypothetical protein
MANVGNNSKSDDRLAVVDALRGFALLGIAVAHLGESRKYALSLTLGTQTLSQLPEESVAAVFGICATIASFRVSGDDAKALVREFAASGEPRGTPENRPMRDTAKPANGIAQDTIVITHCRNRRQ